MPPRINRAELPFGPGNNEHFLEKVCGRRWEGLHGWLPFCQSNDAIQALYPAANGIGVRGWDGDSVFPPADVLCVPELISMQNMGFAANAKPIRIGVGQLMALPDWPRDGNWVDSGISSAACEYANDLQPPFPTTFFDFCDDRGNPAWLAHVFKGGERASVQVCLYGAMVVRIGRDARYSDAETPMFDPNALVIVPYGSVLRITKGDEVTETTPRHNHINGVDYRLPPAAAMGFVSFGGLPPGVRRQHLQQLKVGESMVVFGDMTEKTRPKTVRPTLGMLHSVKIYENSGYHAFAAVGMGELVAETLDAAYNSDEKTPKLGVFKASNDSKVHRQAIVESTLVAYQAQAVLKTLFLLESTNVELVDVPLSRQVRRSVERSNGDKKVALTIHVKTKRKMRPRANQHEPNGRRHFRYSFDRIGHYHHVRHGPHAKESELKPCPLWREKHPESELCRREYIPPAVINAGEGIPYVPKTRYLH